MIKILLQVLAVSLLSRKLAAQSESGVYLTLVADVEEYKADNPDLLWKPLKNVKDVGFVLGVNNTKVNKSGRKRASKSKDTISYSVLKKPYTSEYPVDDNIEITYAKVYLENSVNSGKAFLVDGGIGKNFVSFVFEVPKSDKDVSIATEVRSIVL